MALQTLSCTNLYEKEQETEVWFSLRMVDTMTCTINLNTLNPEARLSQQLSSAVSAQSAPRKAVDLVHLLLNGLPCKFHSKF